MSTIKAKFILISMLCLSFVSRADEIDSVKLKQGSVTRLYWARVLMEDYTKWPKAYELIRFVAQNESTLPPAVIKKLRKASTIMAKFLPEKFLRERLDMRHLTRPFLEAQYLVNEAIMDLRVPINQSNDSEILYIENALKSYFFPGQESLGKIEYPADATYAFDLYALTPVNLAAARLEASHYGYPNTKKTSNPVVINPAPNPVPIPGDPGKPSDPGSPSIPTIPTPPGGGVILPKTVVNQGALDRLSLLERKIIGTDQASSVSFMPPEGFLQNLLDLGVDIKDIMTIAEKLTKDLTPSDRVVNRYRPQALLLQALSDPGSVVLDPQIQDFLRGVKIKVPVMELSTLEAKELYKLFSSFDGDFIKPLPKKEGDFVIDFGKLLNDQYSEGQDLSEILLEHQSSSLGGATLYLTSGVGGADLYRARILQVLLKAAQAYLPVHSKMPWSENNLKLFVTKIPQMLAKLRESQLKYWQTNSWIAQTYATLHLAPQGLLLGARATSRFFELNPKIGQTIDRIAANPKIKWLKNNTENGKLLFAVTLLAVSARITTGIMDANKVDNAYDKMDIMVDTAADSATSLTYLLPYVGWPTMLIDISHDIGWVDFHTPDAYAWLERFFVGSMVKMSTGQSLSEIKLMELDNKWNLPYADYNYAAWEKKIAKKEADPDKLRMELLNEIQDLALRSLMQNYEAHQNFFKERDNEFGYAIEKSHKSFVKSRDRLNSYLDQVAKLKRDGFFADQLQSPQQ
jgi:hypothetical protein